MLLVDRVQLDAIGDLVIQFRKARIGAAPDLDDVFRRQAGHPEREGILPVEPHHEVRGVLPVAMHVGDVEQVDDLSLHPDGQGGDSLDRARSLGRLDDRAHAVAAPHRARVNHAVCICQRTYDGGWRQALVHRARHVGLDEDGFVGKPFHLDIGHPFDGQKLAPQEGGQLVLFRIRVPVGRDRIVDAEHIAETVIHIRLADPFGQEAGGIRDPVAQLGPDRRQFIPAEGREHLDGDQRGTGLVHRGDLVDLAHFLDGGFKRL